MFNSYGFHGTSMSQLTQELGLSKERIRQLEAAAFAKLRRNLEAEAPEIRHFL